MITFQSTADLSASAMFTIDNMRSYYERYGVDWQHETIVSQITSLENWDILLDDQVVGAMRLQFDDDGCYLRDLQVKEPFQSQGIGAKAMAECERLTLSRNLELVKLKVFKISPAHHLYSRTGFEITEEDDRFYYMSKSLIS